MKQNLFKTFALAAMLAVGMSSHATSWRINSNTTRGAHFADINAAMSSADVQDGDTLYLDPGCSLSSDQYVTKCVTIIGNGFFHNQGQPYGFATISGTTILKAAGCKIEGVVMTGQCNIQANNVTVERCKVQTNYPIYTSGSNCKNATIRNCWVQSLDENTIRGQGANSTNTAYWTIENNIIIMTGSYGRGIYEFNSATIRNNIIIRAGNPYYDYNCLESLTNSTICNNILVNKRNKNSVIVGCTDCVINHNVISSAEVATYPNNLFIDSNDLTTIFTMTGANDLQYQLCENSPAKGYATDGGDCGPYGSGYTYVPGGIPLGLPYYTEATIGSMAHDGKVNVTLKISVQDE